VEWVRAVPPAVTTNLSDNKILSSLSDEHRDLLVPMLQPVDLPLRKSLESKNRRIDYVYFLDRGIASVVADGAGRGGIELGIIGREGVTGLAVLMGVDRSPHDTYMQVAGAGRRVSSLALREAMTRNQSLHRALLMHAYTFTVQIAGTALANGRYKLEERLARWLLMAHDRLDSDALPLTHEFLALMLGVRRPGVTVALNSLQNEGAIQIERGGVLIVDRPGLEECSNGAYSNIEVNRR
jgi:CRP-like cAMP-binding protein